MSNLFIPLFDTLNGGPACAWACGECLKHGIHKPVRTRRGLKMHLERVHHIVTQGNLFANSNHSDDSKQETLQASKPARK